MRDISAAELAAIAGRAVAARDLVSIWARDRESGETTVLGYVSDGGDVSMAVVDGQSGLEVTRSFTGAALVSVADIQLVSDLTVRTVDVVFSGVSDVVEAMVRTYDVRGAAVQMHRVWLDPETYEPVAAPRCRFIGFVDEAPIKTAAEGDASTITLTCVSHTRELTRTNPDVRSHASQTQRHAGDAFYKDTGVVGDWTIYWGQKAS